MTATLQLYGVPWSRAMRCIWMLYELGEPFDLVPVRDTRSPEYLALNPNGKVPTLVDGDVVIFESLAINLYVAQTRASEFSPRDRRELGGVLAWTLWAQSELEEYFNRIPSLDAVETEWRNKTLGVLETTLQRRAHLLDERFTAADLNVCCMFFGPVASQLTFETFPSVARWLSACRSRPAYVRTLREAMEAFANRG